MIFDRYKKSFPAKLSLYVISVITILSFVLVGVFYHYSTETLSQEAEDKIESMAAQANLRVSALLSKVEKIPENLGWMIVEYVKEPDSLFGITRRIVKDNPEILVAQSLLNLTIFRKRDNTLHLIHFWLEIL